VKAFTGVSLCAFSLLPLFPIPDAYARNPIAATGQITNLTFTYKFGTNAPGLDQFDALGTYVLGAGSNGLNLPSEAVVASFDGGKFIQAIPSNSFTAITGGWRYLSTNPGVSEIRVMNNGSLTIRVRKSDFSGVNPAAFGPLVLTVGDDTFTAIPNSIPVAKISGPTEATVGSTVVLDATQSTDFNAGDSLTHTWTLVSEPLGSNVSLSSTTNPSVSFSPSRNGNYVLKLVNSDGVADGIPALITVTASGGTDDPPPPPSHENGVISLFVSQPTFLVGESAVITLREDAQPGNGTSRWYFKATLNDQPIAFTPVPNSVDNTHATAPLELGPHTVLVESYLENTNLAKALLDSINDYNTQITAINAALAHESDPAIIAELQAQKTLYMEQIANAQDQLEQNRTKVGETVVLSFDVAEPQPEPQP
jgi:hypothetical protein